MFEGDCSSVDFLKKRRLTMRTGVDELQNLPTAFVSPSGIFSSGHILEFMKS